MAREKRRQPRKKVTTPKKCYFCEEKKEPTFKDTGVLLRFLTERGKIVSRLRSGLCSQHQRHLSSQVKYARHLALLPFVVRG